MKAFSIHFDEAQWDDLRRRIARTRLPRAWDDGNWQFGTDDHYLPLLLEYWRDGYDWSRRERALNQYPQFTCELDGMTIHFFHIRASRGGGVPLLLTHGWPDSFLRYAKVFPLLSDCDLVVPSLPGFAFSTLPPKGFLNNAEVAEIWHRLMTEVLGYRAYMASGGDMGRGVTCHLAANHPREVMGIHLTDVGAAGELIAAPDESLTPAELDYKRRASEWTRMEGAYIQIHSTKPQTLAYSLSDSPAGMAAWIVEKYRAWSDWPLLTMDDLLDCLTLYWMTNTACTSIRAYHGNTFTQPPVGRIQVPTAIAAFPRDILPVPRAWVERNYPVVMYEEMPRGGHFTALEQPETFAENLSRFVGALSSGNPGR
ncbi:MAG: epoxide hydrolase [Clostridia bacterium]|nr:epoxide hydrolase [Clostridia bacterium]